MKNLLFFYALLLSIFLHLAMGGALSTFKKVQFKPLRENIEISILPPTEESKPRRQNQQESHKQIVEQDRQRLNDLESPDAKYLGRHNQRVVKESKATQSGDFRNSGARAAGNPSLTPPIPQKAVKSSPQPRLRDLLPAYDPSSLMAKVDPSVPNFAAPPNHARPQEASQTSDHLKDVNRGLETLLNTQEFVYYSYYERIRTRLRQYWEPGIRHKITRLLHTGRHLASNRDHTTRLIITLNAMGELVRVQVLEQSGVRDLDDAAVEAFRSAAPFPNPPRGIVGADGTIQIRWDFVLES